MIALAALLAAAALAESERVRLEYSTPEGCPDVHAFRESVVARLQRVPFSEDAKRVLEVKVERELGGTLHARLAFREADGSMGGERTLTEADGSCEEFGESLALAATIALDPSFAAAPKLRDGFVVLDPATVGVDEDRARILAEFLRAELRGNGVSVVERSAMTKTACGGDLDCAAEEARRRGVDRAVLLAYERIDQKVVTTAVIVDAATGERLHGERLTVGSLDRLIRPRALARGLLQGRPVRPEPSVVAFGFDAGTGRYRYSDPWDFDDQRGTSYGGGSSLRVDVGLPNGFQIRTRADVGGLGLKERGEFGDEEQFRVGIAALGAAIRYSGPRGAFTGGVLIVTELSTGSTAPLPVLAARFGPEYGLHGTVSLLESRDLFSAPFAAGLGWGFGDRSRTWGGAVMSAQGPGLRFEMDLRTGRRFILSPAVSAGYNVQSGGTFGRGSGYWYSAGLSFGWDLGESNRRAYEGDLLTR